MLTIETAIRKSVASFAVLVALLVAVPTRAAVTKAELAGHPLGTYPFFEYVKAINANRPVHVAIDPSRFPAIAGQTCDIYVVAAKKTLGWNTNNTLTDVTLGGMQTQTFSGGTIQANTFQVTVASELSGAAGTGLGVGYDVVLDCNQNGLLDGNDYIDGRNNESGFYIVNDTTAPGPLAVTAFTYNLSSTAVATFGIPTGYEAEKVFFPTNIASMTDPLPLIVISHGNGHNYQLYDYIGNHLASYGYIVMTHANNTMPGPFSASTTTLAHTDAFISEVAAGNIPGGTAMTGKLDANKIVWIGHSRGAEGVAIGYDRMFDVTYVPVNYDKSDIKLIDSMLPTDWVGTADSDPHDANYHLWTASGDADVNGSAGCELCQTYHLHDRAEGHRQSTTVQGAGHGDFNSTGGVFTGPCPLGVSDTHLIQLGMLLPLVKRYVEDNIPSIDFLTRQYESFRPIGAPTNICAVVSNEYYDASVIGTVVIDDYQTQTAPTVSSSGGSVTYSVDHLAEGKLDDNNTDFTWTPTDPFNGATQVGNTDWSAVRNDTGRGVVFDWTGANRYYEWGIPAGEQNFADDLYLSFRGAQGTQHPYTLAVGGDLTFTVTLRDGASNTSSINIGAYGGGLEQPYQRSGGWHNEMETIRIRLTDFLNNGSGLNLGNIVAVRFNVGPAWGSPQGRVVIDDLVLSNDRAVYDGADNGDPHIRTVSGENYDFQSAGEFTLLRGAGMEIQTRQTPVPSAPPIPNAHTGLTSCVSVNTALAARVSGHRVTFQPSLTGRPNPAGMEVRIDGKLVDLDALQSVPLGGGARVARTGGSGIEIDFTDGTTLLAVPGWWSSQNVWYLNVSVLNTPATEGTMGFIPPGSWLPTLPDGSSMGPRPASMATRYHDLNQTFADAWRVTNATSLFDYAPGMGTDDFTNKAWPAEDATSCSVPDHPPVKPIERAVAERLCVDVVNKDDQANCVFDVVLTGEPNFAKTYLLGQALVQRATETEVYSEKSASKPGEPVGFVAVVKNKKTGERVATATGPAGAVQFTLDGARLGKPVELDAFGRAKLTTTRLKPGKHQIGAAYVPASAQAGLLPSVSAESVDHVVTSGGR
jgi:hypothetical protein